VIAGLMPSWSDPPEMIVKFNKNSHVYWEFCYSAIFYSHRKDCFCGGAEAKAAAKRQVADESGKRFRALAQEFSCF